MKVLIVDDNAESLKNIRDCLLVDNPTPLEIFEAFDGKEALAILNTQKIDAVICDEVMPSLSGSNLAKSNVIQTKNIPVLILSGLERRDLERTTRDLTNVRILTKPFAIDDLHREFRVMTTKK